VIPIRDSPQSHFPQVKLEFSAPEDPGDYSLTLYLMSDSYLGCDQEYEVAMVVVAGDDDGMEEEA
jgi:pre-mRNA-splicing helicase BRR2